MHYVIYTPQPHYPPIVTPQFTVLLALRCLCKSVSRVRSKSVDSLLSRVRSKSVDSLLLSSPTNIPWIVAFKLLWWQNFLPWQYEPNLTFSQKKKLRRFIPLVNLLFILAKLMMSRTAESFSDA